MNLTWRTLLPAAAIAAGLTACNRSPLPIPKSAESTALAAYADLQQQHAADVVNLMPASEQTADVQAKLAAVAAELPRGAAAPRLVGVRLSAGTAGKFLILNHEYDYAGAPVLASFTLRRATPAGRWDVVDLALQKLKSPFPTLQAVRSDDGGDVRGRRRVRAQPAIATCSSAEHLASDASSVDVRPRP